MSRRMGPGGRLRPAPHLHRNATRVESVRPQGFTAPRAVEGGIGGSSPESFGAPDYDAVAPEHAGAGKETVALASDAVGATVLVGESFEVEPRRPAAPASQARPLDRRPSLRGPTLGGAQLATAHPRTAPDGPERDVPACTAPQLRRFIKSRAYVPMHELRRRFAIEGGDDDVSPVDLESGRVFVGLPPMEGQLLGDLLRAREVGFELSMDPLAPVVIGVYAMRPVPRP